ncbi:hypothetical protein RvY_14752 [Ramazzottius varieornatus]|uniref:Gustatory receptor n=1 Tax=Ramazzottius varieornatus TaxID=947166 RepID=A0A1D1VSD7_RAMVA|nr:hypothetical protein RvY_14752 [Ramazzottius varieornatus]
MVSFHRLAAPLLAVLRFGGLYFRLAHSCPTENSNHVNSLAEEPEHLPTFTQRIQGLIFLSCLRGNRPADALSFIFSIVCMLTAATDNFRLLYAFYALWRAGQLSSLAFYVDNLVTVAWTFQCLTIHCSMMYMCYTDKFTQLFRSWEELNSNDEEATALLQTMVANKRQPEHTRHFLRKQKCLLFFAFFALLVNMYSLIGPLVINADVYSEFRNYVMFPFLPENLVVKTLITAAFTVRSFDYVFSAVLFLMLSDALVLQFGQFFHNLAVEITAEGRLVDATVLEAHRLKHVKLCGLVKKVDEIFSLYVLVGLVSGMLGILAQVYVVYDFLRLGTMGTAAVLSYVYWSLLNMLQVLVILWCGSKVKIATVFPMSRLFGIDQRTLSIKESQSVTVFLHKLCNSRTGFTALGIFTIDKATILSLAGFYFTCQILLFQMRNDSSLDTALNAAVIPTDIVIGLRNFLNNTLSARTIHKT